MSENELIRASLEAARSAYCPYSRYHVGAALLCADGTLYTGCNVENASYGATNCAERTAIFKAVSEGKREFSAIAISSYSEKGESSMPYPCGICRQVMSEFCKRDFTVIVSDGVNTEKFTLEELLPKSFNV